MATNLVVVESPSKAKTLGKYLADLPGKFTILASYGHVRDLVPKTGSVDVEHDFAMKYQTIIKNQQHVDKIIKRKKSNKISITTYLVSFEKYK